LGFENLSGIFMKIYKLFFLFSLLICSQIWVGCGEDEPKPVNPEPEQLFEEGKYTITRFETIFTDQDGDTVGIPKSETHYPNLSFTLSGPSHYREELTGAANSATTGSYLINTYLRTIKFTIAQPLLIPAGNYQIDSLTDKRMVMHINTENLTTGITKNFTVRANR